MISSLLAEGASLSLLSALSFSLALDKPSHMAVANVLEKKHKRRRRSPALVKPLLVKPLPHGPGRNTRSPLYAELDLNTNCFSL